MICPVAWVRQPIDWGMGELLAYGTLLAENTSVRLTGQDCVRGTFTHRHSGFYDVKTSEAYFSLKELNKNITDKVAMENKYFIFYNFLQS